MYRRRNGETSMMREKSAPENEAKDAAQESLPKGYTPPKGSATPKRKVAQARNRRPIVADRSKLTKEERKARKAEERKRSDEIYRREQEALRTGDETHMPLRFKGKVRRWGRDYIDASFNISAWFMPIALLIVPLIVLQQYFPQAIWITTLSLYGVFFVMLINAFVLAYVARRKARAIFGADKVPSGYLLQLLGRCFYPRRWRLPSPQVKRGEYPEGA